MLEPAQDYEFDVAISYAPEDHNHVAPLKAIFTSCGIKFADINYGDRDVVAEMWGKNYYDYLINVYQKKARYCIMFLSKHYAAQLWTNLERQAAQARAFKERIDYILPIRLDDTEIPGILPTTFYLRCPPASPEAIADIFISKLEQTTQEISLRDFLKSKHRNNRKETEVLKSTINLNNLLVQYINSVLSLQQQQADEQHLRELFHNVLQEVFHFGGEEVKNKNLRGPRVPLKATLCRNKSGNNIVFQDILFVYWKNFEREEVEAQEALATYLSSIVHQSEHIVILTDGLIFKAYVLDEEQPNQLQQVNSINLKCVTANDAYLWFEAYFLRQNNTPPTSDDIVQRFGLNSPIFLVSAYTLHKALRHLEITEPGPLEVKRQQWAYHLARVYGSANITNNELFIRHTYLCQFAKILVHASRFGIEKTKEAIEKIIDGTAFEIMGVNNIGEQDFFAWILSATVQAETLKIFQRVTNGLRVYDLCKINEDLFKQLYQNLVEPETRHNLGEFYTPDWLAEITLREINYQKGQSLLDPACGSGTFLFTAIRLLHEQGMEGEELVDFALNNIWGIDVHPLAVTIARINYMLALLPHMRGARVNRSIPVSMANALQVSAKEYLIDVIPISINDEEKFFIPVELAHRPNDLYDVLERMQWVAERTAEKPSDQWSFARFGKDVQEKYSTTDDTGRAENERLVWINNVRQLTKQISSRRDSIWIYVLRNTYSPLFLRQRKFDIVVGNPPWIAYRYIQDREYQQEIKKWFTIIVSSPQTIRT